MTRRVILGSSGLAFAATDRPVLPDRTNFRTAETCLNAARWHPLSNGARAAADRYQDYKQRGMWSAENPHPDGGSQPKVKALFAQLINASPGEIAIVQSTTAAENLVVRALGLPGKGGNIVTDALHFEGSLYLYESLRAQGLEMRMVRPRGWRIDAEELERAIDKNTRLVAVSAVSYINGFTHNLPRISEVAHARGALVYADIVQAAGAMPVDVRATGVDFAASASYKWLMGDFGLGFLYAKQSVLPKLVRPVHSYRQLSEATHDPTVVPPVKWKQFEGAAGYFEQGTIANGVSQTLSYSLDYIQRLGVDRIREHSARLIAKLRREVHLPLITPEDARGPIVTFALQDPAMVAERLRKAKVDVSISGNRMRVSPSVYNDERDIDRLVEALG